MTLRVISYKKRNILGNFTTSEAFGKAGGNSKMAGRRWHAMWEHHFA
ncbi:hypothetical protein QYS48_33090 [Marivirga arenosa]|uniref:Uncharacterized protein n=1 Tax=Marivirga arenosa TaxID=3059076 RepID=A0AA51N5Q1_9BACT|nr:hypothetical protein [Marivirga sp. ABR2-2]WMN06617.1 hypothetical protein QYS48_33090 [Marivirga sp. ABR2-2]